ncbi:hypothetical protein BDR26DRAFT_877808 [Obelidium mucronatum]|nr:hypothetical protein BDR26DRAFT_877808 [Obelidium mucronatum]
MSQSQHRMDSDSGLPEVSARLEQLLMTLSTDEFSPKYSESPSLNSEEATDETSNRSLHSSTYTQSSVGSTLIMDRQDSDSQQIHFKSSVTLRSLQETMSTISGYLGKLNGPTGVSPTINQWTDRFFVLAENGSLFLFASDVDPNAMPISFLTISSGFGYKDTTTDENIIRIQGLGVTANGTTAKRAWTLRCPNEETLALWTRAVNRSTPQAAAPVSRQISPFPQRSSSISRSNSTATLVVEPMSPVSPGSPGSLASPADSGYGIQYMRRASLSSKIVGMSRSDSNTSRTSVSNEERESAARARYQEYMAMQESAKGRIQKELAAKREREEKELAIKKEKEESDRIAKEKEEAKAVARRLAEAKRKHELSQIAGLGGWF